MFEQSGAKSGLRPKSSLPGLSKPVEHGEVSGEDGGKDMNIHHDGISFKTSTSDGGEHDHENLDQLKSHLDQFFSEEQHEPQEEDESLGGFNPHAAK